MPGTHYRAGDRPQQPPEYDYYALSRELLPDDARDGDRVLIYDTGQVLTFFRGAWHGEPRSSDRVLAVLEAISEKLDDQTTAAREFLERL
jgi:hypothetical protein